MAHSHGVRAGCWLTQSSIMVGNTTVALGGTDLPGQGSTSCNMPPI